MFGVLVLAREAAAVLCELAGLTAAVVVRVDSVVVVASQLAPVMRQQFGVGVVLIAVCVR